MIVVDASVLVNSLTEDGALGQAARAALRADRAWVGPEDLEVDVFSASRGRYLGGRSAWTVAGRRWKPLRVSR